MDEASYLLRLI